MGFDLMDVFVKIGADTSALQNGINKAMKIAGAAIGTATTAVGAFAVKSIEVGKTFDSSMSQVAATMGVTRDEIGELEKFAMDMGAKTAFSATQAADALNYMALAGYDAETSMQMLPNVLNLAAAGGMDLATASDMVTDAQSALGLSLEETTELVDMMAKTSSKSNTSVKQLGDAILTIGGTAKTLAGGTTELNTALGILADNGIKGAEGGTKLRNVILSLSAPTDTAAKELERLGVKTVDEATGNFRELEDIMADLGASLDGLGTADRAEIISTIFNKQDIAAVNALLDTSSERYDELALAIDGAWMSEKSLRDELSKVGVDLDTAKGGMEKLGITSEEFDSALARSKGDAQDFVKNLKDLADEGVNTNDILSGMDTTVSSLYHAFDRVSGSAEQMAQTQLDNLAGDITLWNSAMEGAQLLISGALAPELREFVKFGTNGLTKISDAFKEGGLSGAMDAFGEVLSKGIGMVTEKIPDAINAGMELLGAVGQGLMDNADIILDAAIDVVNNIMNSMLEATNGEGKDSFILGFFKTLGDALISNAPQLMSTGFQILQNLIVGLAESLPELIPMAIEAILTLVTGLLDNVDLLVDSAISLVMGLAEGLINALPVLLEKAPEIVSKLVEAIVTNAPKLVIASGELMGKLLAGIIENLPRMLEAGMSIVTSIQTGIVRLFVKLLDAGKQASNKVKEGIKSIDPVKWGQDMIDSFVRGIKDRIGKVIEAAKDVANTIKDYLGFSEPKLGPLSNFHTFAPDMMELFAKGIKDNEYLITDQINKSFDLTSDMASSNISASINSGAQQWNQVIGLLQAIAEGGRVEVVLQEDTDAMFRVMQRKSRVNKQITGQPSFA